MPDEDRARAIILPQGLYERVGRIIRCTGEPLGTGIYIRVPEGVPDASAADLMSEAIAHAARDVVREVAASLVEAGWTHPPGALLERRDAP